MGSFKEDKIYLKNHTRAVLWVESMFLGSNKSFQRGIFSLCVRKGCKVAFRQTLRIIQFVKDSNMDRRHTMWLFFQPPNLAAWNFAALQFAKAQSTSLKRSKPPKNQLSTHKTGGTYKIGFTLSNSFQFHGVYLRRAWTFFQDF